MMCPISTIYVNLGNSFATKRMKISPLWTLGRISRVKIATDSSVPLSREAREWMGLLAKEAPVVGILRVLADGVHNVGCHLGPEVELAYIIIREGSPKGALRTDCGGRGGVHGREASRATWIG